LDIAISTNKVPIRLTDERWQHISTGHPEISDYYYEILETIESPIIIYDGNYGELIAVSNKIASSELFLVVVYKENDVKDGFVITAYISNKSQKFEKRRIIWKQ